MVFGKRSRKEKTEADASADTATPDDAKSTARAAAEAPSGEDAIEAERALDFMAEMLRILGEHAFDIAGKSAEEIEAYFETWARHLLVGVPPPSREAAAQQEPAKGASSAAGSPAKPKSQKRDLPGLRRALLDHREHETEYVRGSLGQFRDAAWAFVSGLRRSLTIEHNSDRRIGHRMRRLEGAVRSGDAAKIKGEAQETVTLLTEFLAERGERHQTQISEMAARLEGLRDELDSVRKQAAIDSLTQLYNRASFDEQIEREIDLATLFGKRGCLMMIDIDHFKWVNDTHGHPAGDKVIQKVAETLQRCFMRKDDFVARYGGEEFVIVLRDIALPVARDVSERGMTALRNLEVELDGVEEPLRITVSMGIARLRLGETADSWIERADRALYQAKDAGRDRVEVDAIDLEEA